MSLKYTNMASVIGLEMKKENCRRGNAVKIGIGEYKRNKR